MKKKLNLSPITKSATGYGDLFCEKWRQKISWIYHEYLEGGQVEQGKTVEEADPLQSHLDDPGAVGLLTPGGRLWRKTVKQDAIQSVHHSHQICGLQQGRQSSRVLAFIVKYTGSTGEEERGSVWSEKQWRHMIQGNTTWLNVFILGVSAAGVLQKEKETQSQIVVSLWHPKTKAAKKKNKKKTPRPQRLLDLLTRQGLRDDFPLK